MTLQSVWEDILDGAVISPEPVAKQLSIMWRAYGRRESQVCGTCAHLIRHKHHYTYFKCDLYSMSCGAGTDWRKKWMACGRWTADKNT